MARESEHGATTPDFLLEKYIEDKESGGRPDTGRLLARCATEKDRAHLQELLEEYLRLGGSLPEPEPPPHVVAGYRLLRKIGQGGMGVVYSALSPEGEEVALKLLPPRHDLDPSARERLEREIEILQRLDHPDIVKVLDRNEQGGELVLVLELLDGGSLADRIQEAQRRPDPPTMAEIQSSCRLVLRVARAAHAAHEQGILHRDIKPSNILFDRKGGLRLADFGLAHLDAASRLTSSGKLMGTASYMAPERILTPDRPADPRCDVYSLGVTLYEAIALTLPFKGSITEILSAVRRGPPPLHLFLGYRLDRRLEAILEKSVSERPSLRYPTAAAFASDLEAFLEGRPVLATRGRWRRRCSRAIRRRPVVTATVVGAILVALVIGLARSSDRRERLAASLDAALGHVRSAEIADRDRRLLTNDTAIHDWANLGQNAEALVEWETRYRALARQVGTERDLADPVLRSILVEEPSHRGARVAFLRLHRNAALELQQVGSWGSAETEWQVLAECGEEPPAAGLVVETDPEGVCVRLHRYDTTETVWTLSSVPGAEKELTTPFRLDDLEPGSYLLELRRPEGECWIRHPALLLRGETCTVTFLALPEDEDLGEDWAYIPEGPYLTGGDPLAFGSRPRTRVHVDGFFMARCELTCAEYVLFLQAIRAAGGCGYPDHGRPHPFSDHVPRDQSGFRFDLEGGELLPHAYFLPDTAVHQICPEDALHYVLWRNVVARERGEPWIYSLPTGHQWEKAARGVDGRAFSWGNGFRWDLTSSWRARPPTDEQANHLVPGRFPADCSPYGVLDMVGNLREICSDFEPVSARYLVRGGEESFYHHDEYRLAARRGAVPREVNWDFGIRLVRARKK